ncbi:hypothetical protein KCP75_02475 [Salmonella enterica subsp. enterica]|nr:hypothetical protein KCP75_02475 [Salmonella enterica subsp. enterica]
MVNDQVDQTFRFMHLDTKMAIRMDCSPNIAMAGLLKALRDKFDWPSPATRTTTVAWHRDACGA